MKKDEDAFVDFVRIVDTICAEGVIRFLENRKADICRCYDTLVALSSSPFGAAAGELLVRKVFEIFAKDAVCEYQHNMCNGLELPALRRLHEDYRRTLHFLTEWCKRLRTAGAVNSFTIALRCHLLQPDLLTGESPAGKEELLAFLRNHGRKVLAEIGGNDDETGNNRSPDSRSTLVTGVLGYQDEVLHRLHGLTLSTTPALKTLWKALLVERVSERVDALDDDFTVGRIHAFVCWKDEVVDTFVRLALSPEPSVGADVRAEVDRWCEELEQLLLVSYGRKRIASFWDVVVEFPDSVPTLQDLRFCLLRCVDDTLRGELIQTAKRMLASRLHRAGTRTEDILAILIGTIHSLCVLFSKNDQGSVIFSIVGDTLEHLKKRKDCVSAVVQAITQPSADSIFYADLQTYSGPELGHNDNDDDDDDDDGDGEDGGDVHNAPTVNNNVNHSGMISVSFSPLGVRAKPDVLRVLLSAISVTSLVEEYHQVLASQLLSKPMHDFDTTVEEEVLERLKCAFGEDVLAPCMVMIRDFQASRRYTAQIREAQRRDGRRAWPLSLNVLSTTSWPKLSACLPPGESIAAPERHHPHPLLRAAMDSATEAYKRLKANQRLEWIPSHGTVSLELKQRNASTGEIVAATYELSLFAASLVLTVRDVERETGAAAAVPLVAERIGVTRETIAQRLPQLLPSVLTASEDHTRLSVQTSYVSTSTLTFDEADDAEEQPAGLLPEQVKMLLSMITAMLKARGACGPNDIHNNMKMFAQFQGTLDDMKKLLQMFLAQGKLVLNDTKLYTLP